MNIKTKTIIRYVVQLLILVGLLFLATDIFGNLFVEKSYTVSTAYRWKICCFITAFSALFLGVVKLAHLPQRKLFLLIYPLHFFMMIVWGMFSRSANLFGYQLALFAVPVAAYGILRYGRSTLKGFLRLVLQLSQRTILHTRSLIILLSSVALGILLIIGAYHIQGILHFDLHLLESAEDMGSSDIIVEKEEEDYNPDNKDHREPSRAYSRIFNDLNDTQLVAARKNGVPHPLSMEEIETRAFNLQEIETCKRYKIDPLTHSVPLVVPKTKAFLNEIGKAFQDSLYNRGYSRSHRFIITSVTRTQQHVKKLRRSGNVNASENSCHCYGTTIDITYVRFDKPEYHRANDIKLKEVLMQVIYDQRKAGKCYVKYERKQSCLHITVR